MKKIKVLVIGMMLSMTIPNFSQSCNDASLLEPLALSCQIIDESKSDKEAPRMPVCIPNVYLNRETCTLVLDASCYHSSLNLVDRDTGTVVCSYNNLDGEDIVQLPTNLEGSYELRLQRGNYCFNCVIEL